MKPSIPFASSSGLASLQSLFSWLAIADIMAGKNYPPPMHLRDSHYKDASKYGFGKGYVYTHDNPDFEQQFMPDELKDKKYFKD